MLVWIAFAGASEPVQRSLPVGIPALHVENPAGTVVIRSDPDAAESFVKAAPVRWPEGCRLDFSGDMDLAKVSVVRDEGNPRTCTTDIEVVLAGDTAVAVDQGRGSVQATGMGGSLSVELGAGRVIVAEARDAVDVEVGLGGVHLSWTQDYGGSVAARVRAGRVRADVPYGTWLDHEVKALVRRNPIPEGLDGSDTLTARAAIVRVDTAQSAVPTSTVVTWNKP